MLEDVIGQRLIEVRRDRELAGAQAEWARLGSGRGQGPDFRQRLFAAQHNEALARLHTPEEGERVSFDFLYADAAHAVIVAGGPDRTNRGGPSPTVDAGYDRFRDLGGPRRFRLAGRAQRCAGCPGPRDDTGPAGSQPPEPAVFRSSRRPPGGFVAIVAMAGPGLRMRNLGKKPKSGELARPDRSKRARARCNESGGPHWCPAPSFGSLLRAHRRRRDRLLLRLQLFQHHLHCPVELLVLAGVLLRGVVVHHHVRIDAVALADPLLAFEVVAG